MLKLSREKATPFPPGPLYHVVWNVINGTALITYNRQWSIISSPQIRIASLDIARRLEDFCKIFKIKNNWGGGCLVVKK